VVEEELKLRLEELEELVEEVGEVEKLDQVYPWYEERALMWSLLPKMEILLVLISK
jgi:hypothetical protein